MQMISFVLIGFVIIIFLLLFACNKWVKDSQKSREISNWILLVASYLFVIYADYRFALILGGITGTTWLFAKYKKYSFIGIVVALASLGYFKYMNFFAESFSEMLSLDFTTAKIILPLGISFYVFSAISYIVDVKREKISARDWKAVALYLSFFPKITSGPIQRSKDFFEQMDSDRKVDWESFLVGIQIFMFGMAKKIVLADRLSVFVDQVYETPMCFGSTTVFLAAIAYSFQIYFDFSGYSDMAIGVARILGFHLPRNFNIPYMSHNVTELWKRWHITLSTWLQEYVYISLGGNRKGEIRTYVNLILTMLLGGLWHGANWTYIVWGVLHGVALAVHKLWMKFTDSHKKSHNIFMNMVSIGITFLFTTFCWIPFRAASLEQAWEIILRIFSFQTGLKQIYLWLIITVVIFGVSCVICFVKFENAEKYVKLKNVSLIEGYYPIMDLTKIPCLVVFFVFCGLTLCLAYTGGSPFIYGKY